MTYHSQRNAEQLGSVQEKIDGLVLAVDKLLYRSTLLPTPKELREPCDMYMDTYKIFQTNHSLGSPKIRSTDVAGSISFPFLTCKCPKLAESERRTPPQHSFSLFWSQHSKHLPSCPLYTSSQRTWKAGVRLRVCPGALGYFIEASLAWSNRSLSHCVLARNIVSPYSPAFELMSAFVNLVWENSFVKPDIMSHAVSIVIEALMKLLRTKQAAVSDVLPDGTTIVHVSDASSIPTLRTFLTLIAIFACNGLV